MSNKRKCTSCGSTEFLARGKDKCLKCLTGKTGNAEMVIGLDTGTSTGYAEWFVKTQKFGTIATFKIHQAMDMVLELHKLYGESLLIRYEDARLRKWFGNSGREKLQGAGSIKRDAVIWQDFLKDNLIRNEAVAPRDNKTKLDKEQFAKITKYTKSTSQHARDAAMLVFKYR